jgi:GPH family glycoside/pentoside/hexuronide:cation symporter
MTTPPVETQTFAPIPATAAADRVPVAQKLGYGLGTFYDMWGHWLYPTIAFQIFGLYLHVPTWLIGVAVLLHRLIDAVSDPLFGWLSDNTRSRWGRRRPFMLAGCLLAGAGLPFQLAVAPGWSSSAYFWFILLSSAVYLPLLSCFNMPYQSLGNELTPDNHERTSVFFFKNAIQKIPELGLFFFGNFFSLSVWVGADHHNVMARVHHLFTSGAAWHPAAPGTSPNTLLGAQVYLVLCGLIMIVTGLAAVALVREPYYKKIVATGQSRISIKETLWQTLSCQPFRIQLGLQLAYNIGLSMVGTLGLAATFYYVCGGDKAEGNWWNFWMGVTGMGLGFLGLPVFAFISRRLGKIRATRSVLGLAVVVFAGTWWLYDPGIVWLQIFASGMIAFIGAGFWMLMGSIGADVMDYDELAGGRRREGSFAACGSWINKVGMALGAAVSFFILSWIGFDSNVAQQNPHTIFMIRFLLAAVPIFGLLLALLALRRFPLTPEKMAGIRRQLEARRGVI